MIFALLTLIPAAMSDQIELPGIWSLTPLGALLGIVVIVYWLIASGRLIPKSSHERELAVANRRGDEWKETALEQRVANAEIRKQNAQLIEANRVVESFLRAASPSTIGDTIPRPQGGADVVA